MPHKAWSQHYPYSITGYHVNTRHRMPIKMYVVFKLLHLVSSPLSNLTHLLLSVCPQYTSVDSSSISSLAPSSGSYTSSQPSASALHSTHNSSNSSSISHLANMPHMGNNMSSTVGGIAGLHSAAASAALGLGSNGATATSNLSAPRTTPLLSSTGTHSPPTLGMLMCDGCRCCCFFT